MSKFKAGDTVKLVEDLQLHWCAPAKNWCAPAKNSVGVVVEVDEGDHLDIRVCWNDYETGNGPNNACWWVSSNDVVEIEASQLISERSAIAFLTSLGYKVTKD